eukprot:TRINITY_DN9223_c0_g1_i1.p1 TRINITY_DN9223_c0_g1~~TRINITY_DN9223_c0_g1_i1.p1  ORF type:complete len:349 (-),score=52.83 TRINITY_DN9223_c0_g1_i1:222-1268(-)
MNASSASARFQLSVAHLSGEIVGNLSLSRGITSADTLEKIRKLLGAKQAGDYKYLVLIGTEVLDESDRLLRDFVGAESGEVAAMLFYSNELKVNILSEYEMAQTSFSMPLTSTVGYLASLIAETEGIAYHRIRLLFADTVLFPSATLMSLHKQPLTLSLELLALGSTVAVKLCRSAAADADQEYMVTGSTQRGNQSYNLHTGQFIMLRNHPCTINQLRFSGAGKTGTPKVHIEGTGIFSGRQYEDIVLLSSFIEVPIIDLRKYQLLAIDAISGQVSLLKKNGEVKEDVDLPTFSANRYPWCRNQSDQELDRLLLGSLEEGKMIFVQVMSALGLEKIVGISIETDSDGQ